MRKIKQIIKYILLHTVYKIQYLYSYKKYQRNSKKQYILFGAPEHGNLGDHAILLAEHQFLKDIGIAHVFDVPIKKQDIIINTIKNNIKSDDVVLITGGGFIGNEWMTEENMVRQVLNTFPNNKVIIFPSTIYYKDDEQGRKELEIAKPIYRKHQDLIICAREGTTYEWVKKTYQNVKTLLIPDMVLYLKKDRKECQRGNKVLLCLRKDVERKINIQQTSYIEKIVKKYYEISWTDTVLNEKVNEKNREQKVEKKLQEYYNASLVITDRLHGMIFAAITGTPCIAIGNYNYKVKGVYEWIKHLQYIEFIDELEHIEEKIIKLQQVQNTQYPIDDIREKYCELKQEIVNDEFTERKEMKWNKKQN